MKLSIPKTLPFLSKIRRLNILRALFPMEEIGGLDIQDDHIYLLFLRKRGKGYEVVREEYQSLPKGVVVAGVPVQIDELAYALRKFSIGHEEEHKEVMGHAFIVSLDDRVIFSQPISVPPTLEDENLRQFMYMNLHRIIPFDPLKIYVDWQDVEKTASSRLMFLAAGSKFIIDRYREAFLLAGISAVAIEPHSVSCGRALKIPQRYTALFLVEGTRLAVSCFLSGRPYFRSVFTTKRAAVAGGLGEEKMSEETRLLLREARRTFILQEATRVKDFLISELGKGDVVFLMLSDDEEFQKSVETKSEKEQAPLFQPPEFKAILSQRVLKSPREFGIVFGAAIRGLIPRRDDIMVSVMPVGTEVEYEKKKRKLFVLTIKKTTYAILGFSILLFIGLNVFLGTLLTGENERLSAKRRINVPQDLPQIEETAKKFNAEVSKISKVQAVLHSPLRIIDVIQAMQLSGITLMNVSVTNDRAPFVNVAGVAATRESLILLRDYLAKDARLSGAIIPTQAFAAKSNINFTISFTYNP